MNISKTVGDRLRPKLLSMTNRELHVRICNFLLVFNSSFGLCPTVFEILTFKARKRLFFPTASLFDAPLGSPLEFLDEIYPQKLEGLGYRTVKVTYT